MALANANALGLGSNKNIIKVGLNFKFKYKIILLIKKQMNKKGFTLIELIVVIAIIAVLAAIVAVNVSGYINKSKDAAIEEEMHTIQTAVISANGSASGTWTAPTSTDYTQSVTAIGTALGTPVWISGGFCVQATLKATGAGTWCVDGAGFSNKGTCSGGTCTAS